MTPPRTLEDFDADDNAACDTLVGDTLSYRATGAAAFVSLKGYVDYADALRSIDTGQVIEQDIAVELRKALAGERPGNGTRMQLAKLPGKTFRPINVRSSSDGDYWLFEVQQVND